MQRLVAQIQALVRELRRRRVIRVAVVYAGTAFVILQLGEILVEPFGLPGWTLRLITLLLVLGFPLAVGLAWTFDVTEEGLVRTGSGEEGAGEVGAGSKPFTSDVVIIGLLVLIAGLLLYPRLFSSGEETAGQGSPAGPDTAQVEERSIAVLPFESLSTGEKSKTFAQGVHEDLLTRLSKVSALKVISRTSVQKYQDSGLSLPAIADSLGVRWIVEGGVQEAEGQIRVNAQLIDPETDVHRWADSYQRDLSAEGFFAIQGEIAGEIAGALKAKLTPSEQERIAGAPTEDLKAYRFYVQGRDHLGRATSREDLLRAAALFGEALRQDSTFARAWAGLADLGAEWWGIGRLTALPDSLDVPDVSREAAARRALELDPDLAEGHAALGAVYFEKREGPAALRELSRAVQLKPSYAQAQHKLGETHLVLGRLEEGLRHLKLAEKLDPEHVWARHALYDAYLASGQPRRSLAEVREHKRMYPGLEMILLAEVRALHYLKRHEEARGLAEEMLSEPDGEFNKAVLRSYLVRIEVAAGNTPRARKHLRALRTLSVQPEERKRIAFLYAFSHAALGDTDTAVAEYRKQSPWWWPATIGLRYPIFPEAQRALRVDPRYDELIRQVNKAWSLNPDGSIPPEADVPTSPTDR